MQFYNREFLMVYLQSICHSVSERLILPSGDYSKKCFSELYSNTFTSRAIISTIHDIRLFQRIQYTIYIHKSLYPVLKILFIVARHKINIEIVLKFREKNVSISPDRLYPIIRKM